MATSVALEAALAAAGVGDFVGECVDLELGMGPRLWKTGAVLGVQVDGAVRKMML